MKHIKLFEEFVNEFGPLSGSGNSSADDLEKAKRNASKRSEKGETIYVIGGKYGTYKLSKYYDEGNTYAAYYNGMPQDLDESKIPNSWIVYDINYELSRGQTLKTLMSSKLTSKDISAINAVKPYAMKVGFFDVELVMDKEPKVTTRVDNYDMSKLGGSSNAFVITIKK